MMDSLYNAFSLLRRYWRQRIAATSLSGTDARIVYGNARANRKIDADCPSNVFVIPNGLLALVQNCRSVGDNEDLVAYLYRCMHQEQSKSD